MAFFKGNLQNDGHLKGIQRTYESHAPKKRKKKKKKKSKSVLSVVFGGILREGMWRYLGANLEEI